MLLLALNKLKSIESRLNLYQKSYQIERVLNLLSLLYTAVIFVNRILKHILYDTRDAFINLTGI
jgi:hypothetical protein